MLYGKQNNYIWTILPDLQMYDYVVQAMNG